MLSLGRGQWWRFGVSHVVVRGIGNEGSQNYFGTVGCEVEAVV